MREFPVVILYQRPPLKDDGDSLRFFVIYFSYSELGLVDDVPQFTMQKGEVSGDLLFNGQWTGQGATYANNINTLKNGYRFGGWHIDLTDASLNDIRFFTDSGNITLEATVLGLP
ncbi:hypothetical protein C457_13464 [Haloferax prahovense DSM 18310]|uniref:Uncharacterized protein n=1 Tax=Haloferax prahovense (strain DSM 18310 / JCM 13924 / TL6) TaxID=1227461 RepID=M0G673_HALPT|nr:hypothetical protein [Haloferax prahovense]ELZ67048.1 hypothetical protein C457_13464 [Haloferax prahovense DSM 18310]